MPVHCSVVLIAISCACQPLPSYVRSYGDTGAGWGGGSGGLYEVLILQHCCVLRGTKMVQDDSESSVTQSRTSSCDDET